MNSENFFVPRFGQLFTREVKSEADKSRVVTISFRNSFNKERQHQIICRIDNGTAKPDFGTLTDFGTMALVSANGVEINRKATVWQELSEVFKLWDHDFGSISAWQEEVNSFEALEQKEKEQINLARVHHFNSLKLSQKRLSA